LISSKQIIMKVLVFGPSGAGKTYVSHALQNQGINAFDDGDIEGLSAWYDSNGKKVPPPQTADEALSNHYSFLWSKKFLTAFLNRFSNVYLFGGSGNLFSVLDLFDKVYFLKIDPDLQRKRLLSPSRPTPLMDRNNDGFIIWGDWLEEEAKKRGIPMIDASLTPQQIFEKIR
jgi:hypothetical protein